MSYRIDHQICTSCGACIAECPNGAIQEENGRYMITDKCLECGTCAEICFLEAISSIRPIEAKNMLDKAIAFYKANGREKAFASFNDPRGPFVDGYLYIFALDLNGKILAHGTKPGLIGKGMKEIRDPDAKDFIGEMVAIAKSKGAGSVDYKFENPVSLVVEKKTSFIEEVDGIILGCGYFTAAEWQRLMGVDL